MRIFTCCFRFPKESIAETAHVVGSLECAWGNSTLLNQEELLALPQHHGKMWVFQRCLISGVLFHSKSYKWVVARNDYTVEFYHKDNTYYGLIHTYAKVEENCASAVCNQVKSCNRALAHEYYAILEVLDKDDDQLPKYRGMTALGRPHHMSKSIKQVGEMLFMFIVLT